MKSFLHLTCLTLALTLGLGFEVDSKKSISALNLLFPRHHSKISALISAKEGCYAFESSNPSFVSVRPVDSTPGPCGSLALVTTERPDQMHESVWVTATDVRSRIVLRCEVRVEPITRIEIVTRVRSVTAGNSELIELIGYDHQGNIFSTLEGVEFRWGVSSTVTGSLVRLQSSGFSVSGPRKVLEDRGRQTDQVVFQGREAGSVDLQATLVDTDIESRVTLNVVEQLILLPSFTRPLILFTCSEIRFKIMRKSTDIDGKLRYSEIDDASTRFRIQENEVVPSSDIVVSKSSPLTVKAIAVGRTKVVVRDRKHVEFKEELEVESVSDVGLRFLIRELRSDTSLEEVTETPLDIMFQETLTSDEGLVVGQRYYLSAQILRKSDQAIVYNRNLESEWGLGHGVEVLSRGNDFVVLRVTVERAAVGLEVDIGYRTWTSTCKERVYSLQKRFQVFKPAWIASPIGLLGQGTVIFPIPSIDLTSSSTELVGVDGSGEYRWSVSGSSSFSVRSDGHLLVTSTVPATATLFLSDKILRHSTDRRDLRSDFVQKMQVSSSRMTIERNSTGYLYMQLLNASGEFLNTSTVSEAMVDVGVEGSGQVPVVGLVTLVETKRILEERSEGEGIRGFLRDLMSKGVNLQHVLIVSVTGSDLGVFSLKAVFKGSTVECDFEVRVITGLSVRYPESFTRRPQVFGKTPLVAPGHSINITLSDGPLSSQQPLVPDDLSITFPNEGFKPATKVTVKGSEVVVRVQCPNDFSSNVEQLIVFEVKGPTSFKGITSVLCQLEQTLLWVPLRSSLTNLESIMDSFALAAKSSHVQITRVIPGTSTSVVLWTFDVNKVAYFSPSTISEERARVSIKDKGYSHSPPTTQVDFNGLPIYRRVVSVSGIVSEGGMLEGILKTDTSELRASMRLETVKQFDFDVSSVRVLLLPNEKWTVTIKHPSPTMYLRHLTEGATSKVCLCQLSEDGQSVVMTPLRIGKEEITLGDEVLVGLKSLVIEVVSPSDARVSLSTSVVLLGETTLVSVNESELLVSKLRSTNLRLRTSSPWRRLKDRIDFEVKPTSVGEYTLELLTGDVRLGEPLTLRVVHPLHTDTETLILFPGCHTHVNFPLHSDLQVTRLSISVGGCPEIVEVSKQSGYQFVVYVKREGVCELKFELVDLVRRSVLANVTVSLVSQLPTEILHFGPSIMPVDHLTLSHFSFGVNRQRITPSSHCKYILELLDHDDSLVQVTRRPFVEGESSSSMTIGLRMKRRGTVGLRVRFVGEGFEVKRTFSFEGLESLYLTCDQQSNSIVSKGYLLLAPNSSIAFRHLLPRLRNDHLTFELHSINSVCTKVERDDQSFLVTQSTLGVDVLFIGTHSDLRDVGLLLKVDRPSFMSLDVALESIHLKKSVPRTLHLRLLSTQGLPFVTWPSKSDVLFSNSRPDVFQFDFNDVTKSIVLSGLSDGSGLLCLRSLTLELEETCCEVVVGRGVAVLPSSDLWLLPGSRFRLQIDGRDFDFTPRTNHSVLTSSTDHWLLAERPGREIIPVTSDNSYIDRLDVIVHVVSPTLEVLLKEPQLSNEGSKVQMLEVALKDKSDRSMSLVRLTRSHFVDHRYSFTCSSDCPMITAEFVEVTGSFFCKLKLEDGPLPSSFDLGVRMTLGSETVMTSKEVAVVSRFTTDFPSREFLLTKRRPRMQLVFRSGRELQVSSGPRLQRFSSSNYDAQKLEFRVDVDIREPPTKPFESEVRVECPITGQAEVYRVFYKPDSSFVSSIDFDFGSDFSLSFMDVLIILVCLAILVFILKELLKRRREDERSSNSQFTKLSQSASGMSLLPRNPF